VCWTFQLPRSARQELCDAYQYSDIPLFSLIVSVHSGNKGIKATISSFPHGVDGSLATDKAVSRFRSITLNRELEGDL